MYETIWEFRTARYAVVLDWMPEPDGDLSWADAETLEKLESGEYVEALFRVRVLRDGVEVGVDYLGNSVYADVGEFRRHHLSGHPWYFGDMVRSAVSQAREAV